MSINTENDRLRELLQTALIYLEHPDVDSIPFAMPASVIAARIRSVLKREVEK